MASCRVASDAPAAAPGNNYSLDAISARYYQQIQPFFCIRELTLLLVGESRASSEEIR